MFKNQPRGLYVLALIYTLCCFGSYAMLSVYLLLLQTMFGFDTAVSGQLLAGFIALSNLLPLFGGWIADRWSFSKCVVMGMIVTVVGSLLMFLPAEIRSTSALTLFLASSVLLCVGSGLFKSNMTVIIGDLYNDPRYGHMRDSGFSIFYMAINVGSMFSPLGATAVTNWALSARDLVYNSQLPELCNRYLDTANADLGAQITDIATRTGMSVDNVADFAATYIEALSRGYILTFGVYAATVLLSLVIYMVAKRTFLSAASGKRETSVAGAPAAPTEELTPAQTRSRIVALMLVMMVLVFFWMVFNQNGATLTEFAISCTSPEAWGATRIGFNAWALAVVAVAVYALFAFFQSTSAKGRLAAGAVLAACAAGLWYIYAATPNPVTGIQPQEYQQFNPFFVVILTPVSLALFGWLAKKKKDPSAPRKIGFGMVLAAVAYGVMLLGSLSLTGTQGAVSPTWLITTYLLLTFAELLLSPMGMSFVSSVAPSKYKGSMMGCWCVATAVGSYLVSIPMLLWGKIPLWTLWTILIALCLLSAAFIFSITRRLEAATTVTAD